MSSAVSPETGWYMVIMIIIVSVDFLPCNHFAHFPALSLGVVLVAGLLKWQDRTFFFALSRDFGRLLRTAVTDQALFLRFLSGF